MVLATGWITVSEIENAERGPSLWLEMRVGDVLIQAH